MNRCEALRRVLFLKRLPDDVLSKLAVLGFERSLQNGETLFCENDRCVGLTVVLRGSVKVYKTDSRGREMILGVERAGGSVGDLALFDGGTYPSQAAASSDDTVVFVVPRDRFNALMATHPQIAVEAVHALAVEQRKLIEMLKAQALHTVRGRLAAYLLATDTEDGVSFPLQETNATIGSRVGTVREVVSRTLRSLEDAGMITLQGRTVTVCDREALRRLAQPETV